MTAARAKTLRLGLVGSGISHSLSPLLHEHWMARHGIQGTYDLLDVPPGTDIAALLLQAQQDGYSGLNITHPFKDGAFAACAGVQESASRVRAVNTIALGPLGPQGHNTDIFGFAQHLRESLPGWSGAASCAVILGAGGAARAALTAMLNENCSKIYVLARDTHKTQDALSGPFFKGRVEIAAWQERSKIALQADLLVNATPIGGQDDSPLPPDTALSSRTAVYDMIYAPARTKLLQLAMSRNCPVIGGLGMLVHQARAAFAIWTGITPAIDPALSEKLQRYL